MMQVSIKRHCLRDEPFRAFQGVIPPVPGKMAKNVINSEFEGI